jgi:hypothetical protein
MAFASSDESFGTSQRLLLLRKFDSFLSMFKFIYSFNGKNTFDIYRVDEFNFLFILIIWALNVPIIEFEEISFLGRRRVHFFLKIIT